MRLIFDNYGWGTLSSGEFTDIIIPIGQNIKQPARLVEVGTANSILVTASRNGSFIADARIYNIFEGMVIDMSAFALMFPDLIQRETQDPNGSGAGYTLLFTYYYAEGGQNAITTRVYPLGCARLGFSGGTGATNTYNYAVDALKPTISNVYLEPLTIAQNDPVAGFYDGVRVEINPVASDYLFDARAGAVYSTRKDDCNISMWVKNNNTYPIRVISRYGEELQQITEVLAGATVLVSHRYWLGGEAAGFKVFGQNRVTGNVTVSRIMVNKGDCAQPYTLHALDIIARGRKGYMGYLTDYRDGYFNYIYWTGDDGRISQSSGYPSKVGVPYNQRIFYAVPKAGNFLVSAPIDAQGARIGGGIRRNSGWAEVYSSEANAMHDRVYYWEYEEGGKAWVQLYGVERYKKKDYHNEPQTNKVALRWLNSRGMFDSMFFVDFTLTPKLTEVGTVDSYDIVVKTKVTWDNEEALFYLTRSPNIQAITPVDIAQWGVATSESNGVFALNGGNIGKTLTLKFNYKIFGI